MMSLLAQEVKPPQLLNRWVYVTEVSLEFRFQGQENSTRRWVDAVEFQKFWRYKRLTASLDRVNR